MNSYLLVNLINRVRAGKYFYHIPQLITRKVFAAYKSFVQTNQFFCFATG